MAGGRTPHKDMVRVPDGVFRMGSERFYPEERPVREVAVSGFWIETKEKGTKKRIHQSNAVGRSGFFT